MLIRLEGNLILKGIGMKILEYIWQLPQNLLGVLWKKVKKSSIITEVSNNDIKSVNAKAYLVRAGGAVTLGKYIFIGQTYRDQGMIIRHECGHVKQSKILGPLYLIIIGVPSILHAWLNDYIGCCSKHKEGYYHWYTEKWANNLMGLGT